MNRPSSTPAAETMVGKPPEDGFAPADVSVVICAYTLGRWTDLCAAIDSVLQQEDRVGELIVVIDHADDLLDRSITAWSGPREDGQVVRVVASEGEPGLSGARDTGSHLAKNAVVAFLDDDAVAAPDWSRWLAAAYAAPAPQTRVIGVGGFIEPSWPNGARPAWFPPAFDWVVGCSYEGSPQGPATIRNAIGANMSVLGAVLSAVGGFDSRVGRLGNAATGCEETEMYIRATASGEGYLVRYEPRSRVVHRVTPERATWRYFARRCFGEGRSKAVVSTLAGSGPALASERDYVRRVLPRAFARGLFSRDPRCGLAVVGGLGLTAAGYAMQRVMGWKAR